MNHFDLVIFDCDGTLVDSEALNNTITADLLAELGLTQYTPDYSLTHFIGRSQPEIWAEIERETGTTLPADMGERYVERFARSCDLYMKAVPGALSVVEAIARTHRVCVASNGELGNVRASIIHTGLSRFFPDPQIFVAAMVARAKPAPDLFLHAAARNGVRPERCLVIEDSVAGASAGIAAGMTVYGYTGVSHQPEAQAAKLRAIGVCRVESTLDRILDILSRAEAV